MQVHPLLLQNPCFLRHFTNEIQHCAVAAGGGRAERQVEDGAQVVLELARLRAFDSPVARVVYARSHLVGDQSPSLHEELDGENPGIAEVNERTPEMARGLALKRR